MPIAMEFFPGSEREPIEVIKRKMDECDYFLLVMKGKYGSICKETGKSFTEMEYEYALEKDIPTLIFIYSEPQNLRASEVEYDDFERRQKLELFIGRIKQHTVSGWTNAFALSKEVVISMNYMVENNKRAGYRRFQEVQDPEKTIKTYDQVETQKKKFGYIRFFHLSKEGGTGTQPLYHRFIHRLNKSIPVYDEYVLYRLNEFFEDVTGFVSKDTSTGVVDMSVLNPWQARLLLPEGTYEQVPGELEETSYTPSRVFVTTTHYYNAFQKNQYAAIKMGKDTFKATLIVDFRSIPNSTSLINSKNVRAYVISGKNNQKTKLKVQTNFPEYGKKYVHIDSLFWINIENLKQGDVLRLDFSEAINWDLLQGGSD